jgi:hypothetical protein
MGPFEGVQVCAQRLFCVVCSIEVAKTVVANAMPMIVVCHAHQGPRADRLNICASWKWLRDRLKEAGDKWLEEYGGLQGMRDLPQPIREAIGEWQGVDRTNVA